MNTHTIAPAQHDVAILGLVVRSPYTFKAACPNSSDYLASTTLSVSFIGRFLGNMGLEVSVSWDLLSREREQVILTCNIA